MRRFSIENIDGLNVAIFSDGGSRPVTDVELSLYQENLRMRKALQAIIDGEVCGNQDPAAVANYRKFAEEALIR